MDVFEVFHMSNIGWFVCIRNALSCLLQNSLRGGEILFETEKPRRKPRLLYFKQHFHTEEVILQQTREQVLYFYSTAAMK